jgi:hypothetical protein
MREVNVSNERREQHCGDGGKQRGVVFVMMVLIQQEEMEVMKSGGSAYLPPTTCLPSPLPHSSPTPLVGSTWCLRLLPADRQVGLHTYLVMMMMLLINDKMKVRKTCGDDGEILMCDEVMLKCRKPMSARAHVEMMRGNNRVVITPSLACMHGVMMMM